MSWAARILLVGILAMAIILILSAAITFAAPYLAAIIVILIMGRWLITWIDRQDTS